MISCVLFDIDDTLFPSSEFAALARRNALRAMIGMGIHVPLEMLESSLQRIIKEKGSNYPRHFDELCHFLRITRPARFVAAAVAAYHDTKTAIMPYPEVPLTLLRLKESGYKLYIATNGNAVKQWDKLIRLRIALYFDDVFVSEEIGGEKCVAFFRKIVKRLGVKAEECIMIGDREESDIVPAKKIGMKTIRIRRGRYAEGKTVADSEAADLLEAVEILKKFG